MNSSFHTHKSGTERHSGLAESDARRNTCGVIKLCIFLGATIGGWIGWYLGAFAGTFTAFIVSMVGTGVGMYYGRRAADRIVS